MRLQKAWAFLVSALVAISGPLLAQTLVPDVATLRTHSGGYGSNAYLLLQGYRQTNDGGGGTLVGLGQNICQVQMLGSNWSSGSTTVDVPGALPSIIALGMGISGTGIPAGDIVVGFATGSTNTITLQSATTAMGSNATLSGDNGGTNFVDITNYCFTRMNSTYNQVEWGAHTDASVDDTFSLQNWLSANQPHIAVPGNSRITSQLNCPDNTVIQGSPTVAVAETAIVPTFQITSDNSAGGLTGFAMLKMNKACAIHGVGVIVSTTDRTTGAFDTVDVDPLNGTGDLIDGHSELVGGRYNLFKPAGSGVNLEIYDSTLLNSYCDNANIHSSNVKLVRNAFAGAGQGVGASDMICANLGSVVVFNGSDVLISNNLYEASRFQYPRR